MLRVLCLIQAAVIAISLILVLVDFIRLLTGTDIALNISELLYMGFMSYFLYVNIRMVCFKEFSFPRLRLCIFVNLFQVFQLSFWGIKYGIISAFAFIPYLSWTEKFRLGFKFKLLQPELTTTFLSNDSSVRLGVNLISLCFTLLFVKQYEIVKKELQEIEDIEVITVPDR